MIQLVSVRLRNFLSHMSTGISLESNGHPILVVGRNTDSVSCESNGSGKSALFEAIAWCLYGSTLRGLSSKEVTRKGLGKCCAQVIFTIADEGEDRVGEYTVTRHQKDGEAGNSLEFFRGDASVALKDKRDTQRLIESVLGVDFQLFCESTILGQDSLSFATATDAEKKRILEHVARMERFGNYLAETQRLLTETRRELQESDVERARMSERQLSLQEERVRVQRAAESFEQRKQQDLEALKLELQDYEDQAALSVSLQQEIDAHAFDSGPLEGARRVEVEATTLHTSQCVAAAQRHTELSTLRQLDNETRLSLDGVLDACPTCKRPFDPESLKATREGLLTKSERLAREVLLAVSVDQEATTLLNEARVCRETALAFLAECEWAEKESDRQQYVRQTQLIAAQQAADAAGKVQSRISSVKLQRNADLDRAAKLEIGLKQVSTSLSELETKRAVFQDKIRYLEFWVKGFGKKGIRSFVLDGVANALNTYAAKYSQFLTDGEIEVVFSTQRKLASGAMTDDFHVQGLNQHGADVYKGNSVGERQRVDVCVALALQDLIRSQMSTGINLFVCDEAAANLDREGSERMLSLLNVMARDGRVVFYVTHDTALQDLFTQRLEVVKQGGVSRIEP